VADPSLATQVNAPGAGVVNFPVWLTFRQGFFNSESVITSQLEEIIFADAGSFELEKESKLAFTPLLTSSTSAGEVDNITVRMVGPQNLDKHLKADGRARVVAGLLSGNFESAFPSGPPAPPPPKKGEQPKAWPKRSFPHLTKAKAETSVMLVGDTDFLGDRFSVRAINFFGQQVMRPINDNLSFVLNATEFMAGNQDLIYIRSRGKISRPFTKVLEIQIAAQQEYQQQEAALSESLKEVRAKLEQLENRKDNAQKRTLDNAQLETIRKFRLEEQSTSRALREVRKVLRQDIESLGNTLLILNLLVMPLLVAIFGFVVIYKRSQRSGGR